MARCFERICTLAVSLPLDGQNVWAAPSMIDLWQCVFGERLAETFPGPFTINRRDGGIWLEAAQLPCRRDIPTTFRDMAQPG